MQVAETGVAVPERPRLRQLLKSFSTGTRSAEKMHNVKENVKQLLMPWKRKLAEAGGEQLQNNDDFGTHPVLQVAICLQSRLFMCHSMHIAMFMLCLLKDPLVVLDCPSNVSGPKVFGC